MFVTENNGNKKVHKLNEFIDHIDKKIKYLTVCGSGQNSAGQTWKRATNYFVKEIESVTQIDDKNLCSKCFK